MARHGGPEGFKLDCSPWGGFDDLGRINAGIGSVSKTREGGRQQAKVERLDYYIASKDRLRHNSNNNSVTYRTHRAASSVETRFLLHAFWRGSSGIFTVQTSFSIHSFRRKALSLLSVKVGLLVNTLRRWTLGILAVQPGFFVNTLWRRPVGLFLVQACFLLNTFGRGSTSALAVESCFSVYTLW